MNTHIHYNIILSVFSLQVHEFYSSAVLISDKDMCTEFRIRYLKWHHQHQGILEARKFFRALILMEPVDSQLYLAMISLEKAQHFIEYKIINKLYVELCGKFFQHDTSKCYLIFGP